MKLTRRLIPSLLLCIASGALLPACTSPEVIEKRQDEYTEWYGKRQDVRSARQQGRDDRYHQWYDRVMHKD